MVEYSADGKIAVYCGYKFRKDPKTGYFLCTKKTDAQRRERLHVFVWRTENGDVPKGCHIHHIDGNKNNNEICNLACVNGKDHVSYHGKANAQQNRAKMSENLRENALPAAAQWHGSEVGRRWHSAHAKETMGNMKPIDFECKQCGRIYKSLPLGGKQTYCSNKCKTKARRESGVDNEERICVVCGKTFFSNKYQKTKSCSKECKVVLCANRKR